MGSVIFHLDLDSFYVSAERLRRPELKGKCVAVGGTGPRAVLSSASYEARKFGVRSAQPTAQALRACPQLIVVPPDFSLYSPLSKRVFAVVARFAPEWEAVSIDEGYLDMTGTEALHGPPLEAAARIRSAILAETRLVASIGIAANRRVAKVATDACKPDGVLWVKPGDEPAFLAPRPVRVLPGVGPATERWLHSRGLFTLGDVQKFPRDALARHLGEQGGAWLFDAAWGRGSAEMNREPKNRSISRERTYERDVGDRARLEGELWDMCRELGRELREEGLFARVTKLKLRYPPFETVARSRVLAKPANTDAALFEAARALFREHWESSRALRLVGVGFQVGEGAYQPSLFESPARDEKAEALDRLKDAVRGKFGDKALGTGRDLG